MAYTKAQREEIALSNGAFQRQVGGCLFTHARYLYDVSKSKQDRDPDETAIVLSVVANVDPFVVPMSRAVLHYPTMDGLSDVATLTDAQVMDLIPTLWPMMVSAWRGVVLE